MKQKKEYRCKECNSRFPKWAGKCPACQKWNCIEEVTETALFGTKTNPSAKIPQKMKDVIINSKKRILTGISEFDREIGRAHV